VSTDGATGSDEYVELYNAGTCPAPLNGWTLKYSSGTASTPSTRWTGATTDSLATGGYFVIANSGFGGASDGSLSSGLAATAGGLGVFDAGDALQDAMAYGAVIAGHPFVETAAAAMPPTSQSVSRSPNGTDTDDNSKDFKVSARSPGASNP
jgi:hypothetical protein